MKGLRRLIILFAGEILAMIAFGTAVSSPDFDRLVNESEYIVRAHPRRVR